MQLRGDQAYESAQFRSAGGMLRSRANHNAIEAVKTTAAKIKSKRASFPRYR